MDSTQLMSVLTQYQNEELNLIEASFLLVRLGCSSGEAIALLDNYKPTEITEDEME